MITPVQMQFAIPLSDPDGLRMDLERRLQAPVRLTLKKGRSHLVEVIRKRNGEYWADVHEHFLYADEETLSHLARFLRQPTSRNSRALRKFALNCASVFSGSLRQADVINPKGKIYDLERVLSEVNSQYFQNRIKVSVTWGQFRSRRRIRSIQLGSYVPERRLIRIHPVLDHEKVPDYVVARVVYHEMLHHLLSDGGRLDEGLGHSKAFRKKEKEFRFYQEAQDWEERKFPFLLKQIRRRGNSK